jgi:hypothetical protein
MDCKDMLHEEYYFVLLNAFILPTPVFFWLVPTFRVREQKDTVNNIITEFERFNKKA